MPARDGLQGPWPVPEAQTRWYSFERCVILPPLECSYQLEFQTSGTSPPPRPGHFILPGASWREIPPRPPERGICRISGVGVAMIHVTRGYPSIGAAPLTRGSEGVKRIPPASLGVATKIAGTPSLGVPGLATGRTPYRACPAPFSAVRTS